MPDPISVGTLVAAALATGAGESVGRDVCLALKPTAKRSLGRDVDMLDASPESKPRQAVVAELVEDQPAEARLTARPD